MRFHEVVVTRGEVSRGRGGSWWLVVRFREVVVLVVGLGGSW